MAHGCADAPAAVLEGLLAKPAACSPLFLRMASDWDALQSAVKWQLHPAQNFTPPRHINAKRLLSTQASKDVARHTSLAHARDAWSAPPR